MAKNILFEIVENTRNKVAERKLKRPLCNFKEQVKSSTRSLEKALSGEQVGYILECKKASPSKGLIRADFNLETILNEYKDFASAISILTDEDYFSGDLEYIKTGRELVKQPILCKDFFIDSYQVYEARDFGADAILLMLSVLDDSSYLELASIAQSLELDILTEVHDEAELQRAIKLKAKIIGINNRNLKDLSIDLATTEALAPLIPSDRLVISESGIENRQQVNRLSSLVDGFLIGSSIMGQADIRYHCKSLIFGNVKICGLSKPEDAVTVDRAGGNFAGLVFYSQSARNVELAMAKKIVAVAKLNYVGVFVDEDINTIVELAKALDLFAVQLHGHEDSAYVEKLRQQLNEAQLLSVEIWQAYPVKQKIQFSQDVNVDHYLLDSHSEELAGGSGQAFDWHLLDGLELTQTILAGGINPHNVKQAARKNPFALDLSSGVEERPGEKSAEKIHELFLALKTA